MQRNLIRFLLISVVSAIGLAALPSCGESSGPDTGRRVLVIGMDGLDPRLLAEMMETGKLPNFLKLSRQGGFAPLETSTPPQSPVAWSNFITGNDASAHGIFDFIHRDPKTLAPYLSTGGAEEGLLRLGTPFWRYLLDAGVDTTIFRVPANYPPDDPGSRNYRCLSGMGTPDLLGTYGTFSKFTEKAFRSRRTEGVSGGAICRLRRRGDVATGVLTGPENPNYEEEKASGRRRSELKENLEIHFEVVRDPDRKVARLTIQDQQVLLSEGDWSDWCRVTFTWPQKFAGINLLDAKVRGIVRFMLLQTHPTLELYASPVNFDPLDPAQPISVPEDYAKQIARQVGLFYTQGIPEDHSALSEGALTDDEYLIQARTVMDERLDQFDFALNRFKRGFLFFYFGGSDQVAHMFWRDLDPRHPTFTKALQAKYGQVILDLYRRLDEALGKAMAFLDADDTLIVMSDHGFNSFRRGFNLNSWLLENGYISLLNEEAFDPEQELFMNVDWTETKAYGLGINLLFVNLRGRERDGIVTPAEYPALLHELKAKLLEVRDPENDQRVIETVYLASEIYPGVHDDPEIRRRAPDLFVGYAAGYRASWKTVLGAMPEKLVVDNTNRWSGDHCVATELVPGVFFASKALKNPKPRLIDVAPTILDEFGIETPKTMKGRPIF